MNITGQYRIASAREQVAQYRQIGSHEHLAESLEGLASALLQEAALIEAASSLEEAASLWSTMNSIQRQGSCLLLAACSRRLAGDMVGAQANLDLGLATALPPKLKNGFEVEWCEQELAKGHCASAYSGFTAVLDRLADELEDIQKAQLYQHRAAAAIGEQKAHKAADDFLHSATIFDKQGLLADAEASALAAAAILAEVDPVTAEEIISEIIKTIPHDGPAAIRRGLVGGKVAIGVGDPKLALKRFDEARQGALDVGDPISYQTAAVEASHIAESLGDFETAYARLATAWVSLSDIFGGETGAKLIRPDMIRLRDRLGIDVFNKAKHKYESKHRAS